jgi:glycosyltransferase involved in cell wall biosynthesis
MRDEAKKRGIELIFLPELGREIHPIKDVVTFIKLFRMIREIKPHIVHTHTAKAGALGRLAGWLAGVPAIVHTFHGHIFHSYFGRTKTKVFIVIERALSMITDKIIALTESQKDEIMGFGIGDENRFSVIPLGFELNRFYDLSSRKGVLKKELGIQPDTPLIGIVARLVPIKDHRTFLTSASVLLRKIPAKFIVVGDGELRADLEKEAERLGIKDEVLFLGFREDLENIYADLSILVLSSLNEGLPVAIIEAQSASVPVVSTSVGGVDELIEDGITGYLVPKKDPDALADAMERVLRDEEGTERMVEEAKKRVKRFEAEKMVRAYEELYEELAR